MANYVKTLNKVKVSEIMSRTVISVFETTGLEKVENIFSEGLINHLPVINEQKKLTGIISQSDLLNIKDWGKINNNSKEALNKILLRSRLAKDVMTPNPISIHPQDSVGLAAEYFMEKNFKCLPVVDDENRVLGVLTTYDLIVLAYTDFHQKIIF